MVISDGRPAGVTWDYDRVELITDGVLHVIGLVLGLVGAIAIIIVTARSAQATDTLSVAIYASALLTVLGLSAAYNMWPVSRVKWVLRRFDHSAIYLLIAGTYTPFIAQLKSGLVSASLMIGIWLTAIIGTTLKLLLPGRFDRLAVGIYLAMGWSGFMVYDTVVASLPPLTLWFITAGGVLYSFGIVFHAWQRLRFQNAIWHSFVLLGAACHYTAVLDLVVLT